MSELVRKKIAGEPFPSELVVIPLSDVRPSTSRSDELGASLIRRRVDAERISIELERALSAVMMLRRPVYSAGGVYIKHEEVEVPDWKARLGAIKQIVLIRGWEFNVEKLVEGGVSRDILMVVRNLNIGGKPLNEASIEELERRHKADVAAGLVEDAEVEEEKR